MKDDFEEDNDLQGLLSRFEAMIDRGAEYFFDSEDFEDIIDYYLDETEVDKAKIAIEAAQHQYPYNRIFDFKKAQLLDFTRQEEEALKILSGLLQTFPEMRGDIHYLRGSIYSKLQNHQDAIDEYKKALKYNDDSFIRADLGFEYADVYQYDEAIRQFKKVLEYDPEEDYVMEELVSCYEKSEEFEEGIKFFQKFLSKNPYSAEGWHQLGILYDQLGLYEKSIEAFDFVIALEPMFFEAYIGKGNTFVHAGMYHKAIEAFKEAMQTENPEVYCRIGDCYLKLKKYDDAQHYFNLVIKHNSEYHWAWYGMACLYFLQGNYKQALVHTQKAYSLFEEFLEAIQLEGDIYMAMKKYDKAIISYRKVADEWPLNLDNWFDLVTAYTASKDINAAISVLNEACNNNPENIDILYYCIEYLIQQKSVQTAIEYIKRVFPKQPSIIDILFKKFPVLKNDTDFLSFVNTLYDETNKSLPENNGFTSFNN